ncbi:MAG: hypothetical protein ABI454_10175 [Sphingomicrobium sp.]
MTAPAHAQGSCRLIAGEKVPAGSGGAEAICAAVERAAAAKAPDVRYSAEIRVLSSSMLAAKLVANGRKLPEQKFAVMDGEISASAIERFADAVATALAEEGKR